MKSRRFTIRRVIWLSVALLLAAGIAAPYLQAGRFGARIRQALEGALHRKVEIADVRFNLFRGPGFSLLGVVIHDDPATGLEPFAYVTSIEARVRLTSLLVGRLEFASLRLEEPSINLVKTAAGVWNFQPLLSQAATVRPPAIVIRGGRLNFKLGGVKSVFYFSDADLDVRPGSAPAGSIEIVFSGEPARSDRTARGFGTLSGRGQWRPGVPGGEISLDVDFEKSSLGELIALVHGYDIGVHGQVGGHASFRGLASGLDITGTLQLSEIHRWDLLPPYAQGGPLNFRGKLDLLSQTLDIETMAAAASSLGVRFHASNYLGRPQWTVSLVMDRFPIQPLADVARHFGAVLPEALAVEGGITGSISYAPQDGVRGSVVLTGAKIGLPNTPPVSLDEAKLTLDGDRVRLAPVVVGIGPDKTGRLEFDYLNGTQRLDLRLSTDSMTIAALQTEAGLAPGLAPPPFVASLRHGDWSGALRYRSEGGEPGRWSGAVQLRGTEVAAPGLAQPFLVQQADIQFQGERITAKAIDAKAGALELSGEFQYDPAAVRPVRITCRIARLQASDLEALLTPTLRRPQGFISRTLRLGRAIVPPWLAARRAEGSVEVSALSVAGQTFESVRLRFFWDGAQIDVPRFQARVQGGVTEGYLRADLGGPLPSYVLAGHLEGADWKGGALNGDGSIQTSGVGSDLYGNLRAEGSFRARSVVLGSDLVPRTLSGLWALRWDRRLPRLDLNDVRLTEGRDVFAGQGTTLDNEQLRIDLSEGEKRLRLMGGLDPIRLEVTEIR